VKLLFLGSLLCDGSQLTNSILAAMDDNAGSKVLVYGVVVVRVVFAEIFPLHVREKCTSMATFVT
jgi:hypothetical protein